MDRIKIKLSSSQGLNLGLQTLDTCSYHIATRTCNLKIRVTYMHVQYKHVHILHLYMDADVISE